MSLKRLCLFCALLLLSGRWAAAQPGPDPYRFSARETCNDFYVEREYVFVGRVKSVEEAPNPYGGGVAAWKAVVEVETPLKGQTGEEVELFLAKYAPTTAPQVKGRRFIFTAARIAGRSSGGLYSDKWSTPVDEVPPDVMAGVLDGIRDVLRGVPQPRIVGTVREQSRGVSFAPDAGLPLSDILVVAESKAGRRFETRSDAEGRFSFDRLPAGAYAVSPVLPRKMVLYDEGFMRAEAGKKYVLVDEGPCARELGFVAQDAGDIAGSIRREKGDWAFGKPIFYLYRLDPESHRIDPSDTILVPSDVSLDEAGAENLIRFSFRDVPAGSYVLEVSNIDPSGRPGIIYYPGVSAVGEAAPVEVSANKTTEIVINLPPLRGRRIFGRTVLPDGTPVDATVMFVNVQSAFASDEPVESLSAYDFSRSVRTTAEGGRFEFHYWDGRRLKLYAYFDGTKDGARVRFFGQTRTLTVAGDLGPILITLDRSEPIK